jgi:hypothetical protein
MSKSDSRKHENYELLNMIGYGLAKFNDKFVKQFGFKTKTAFYQYLIKLGVGDTIGTIKNRQDLLDPFFESGRRGWWQRKNNGKAENYLSIVYSAMKMLIRSQK